MRSYREAMRQFATLRNLELWYARLDVARILSHTSDRVTRKERSAFKQRVAGARAKDHLRALTKLTQRVDGSPRIVSRPPLIVPVEELFPGASVEEQVRDLIRAYRAASRSIAGTCWRTTAIRTWHEGSAASARGHGSSSDRT